MKAAVLGATGYAGMTLLRLLAVHPKINAIAAVSSSKQDNAIQDCDTGAGKELLKKTSLWDCRYIDLETASGERFDVVFSALPHVKSGEMLEPFMDKAVVIDLSADFRLKDAVLYKRIYGKAHPAEDLLEDAVYGLSEVHTEEIRVADIIANPGCYPTCSLLPLIPFTKRKLITGPVIINAASGISGAGKKEKTNLLYSERAESACAYAPGRAHRHLPEIEQELSAGRSGNQVFFTPHLVPMRRGMMATITFETEKAIGDELLFDVYRSAYRESAFVRITGRRVPETGDVLGSNRCDIGWHIEGKRVFLFSVIDNLVKGAAGQAVQNMNIRFDIDESTGLSSSGSV
ncbi:MAG: N-acetyl-gamma-glutamyl-phosphate reductase [Spirochaetia bacterium]